MNFTLYLKIIQCSELTMILKQMHFTKQKIHNYKIYQMRFLLSNITMAS